MSNTEIIQAPAAAVAPGDFTREQIDLIKDTVAKGTSDVELKFFLEVCKSTGLNPFHRQVHAVMRNSREQDAHGKWIDTKKMVIQTAIDGYRLIAARTGQLAGIDDTVFDTEDAEHPKRATVTVYRLIAGQRVAFTATARWSEYVQTNYKGEINAMWKKMPYTMLGKCAEALALRKGFPAELSGVYTNEEMAQADNPAPTPTQQPQPQIVKQQPQKKIIAAPEPVIEQRPQVNGRQLKTIEQLVESRGLDKDAVLYGRFPDGDVIEFAQLFEDEAAELIADLENMPASTEVTA